MRSARALTLQAAQELHDLPQRKAQREGATRWRSEHAEARWFRIMQYALYDVRYCSEGKENEALGLRTFI